ncbi:hypothetical protein BD779DRAFT_1515893 [Infundibulicybe gibba]|nr:hypothetical protein BD779DRAFT_1515893 [Infundibulicybe gibba]
MDKTQYSDSERSIGSSSQVWNTHLLTVDRSKELPKLRQNPAFWRRKRRNIIIIILVITALVAGIVAGVTIAVSKKHHTSQSLPSSAPSSANSSSSPISSVLPSISPSSSSSAPGPIPSRQPVPATLAAAFQSSFWIWQGAQALTGVQSGDWAFRKTLPTSTAPAREAVALLTADNSFQLYHNDQLVAESSPLGWEMATAVHVNLDPSSNVFAIQAHNFNADADPNGNSSAGLLASIQISYADGATAIISSDNTWRVTQPIPDGFQSPSFNDTQWQFATTLVKYGFGPWGTQVTIPLGYNITAR